MNLNPPFRLAIAGINGSGKSSLIRYVIKSVPMGRVIIFSTTAQNDPAFNNIGTKILPSKEYVNSIGDALCQPRTYHVLLIFDDIAGDVYDSPMLRRLFANNRHYNVSIIFSIQH